MSTNVLDVRDFGAIGDGRSHPIRDQYVQVPLTLPAPLREPWSNRDATLDDELDWLGIQSAIVEAYNRSTGLTRRDVPRTPVVLIPPGRYRLSRPIIAGVDDLTIRGRGAELLIDIDKEVEAGARYPGITVQRGAHPRTELVRNVRIEGVTIRFVAGGPVDVAGLGIYRCADFLVDDCAVIGDGREMEGSATNGIAVAHGESTGVIRHCLVDGVSKPGFYAAAGHDIRFEGCVARNVRAGVSIKTDDKGKRLDLTGKAPGFAIANAHHVIVSHCQSYRNDGPGLQISNTGFWAEVQVPTASVKTLILQPDARALWAALQPVIEQQSWWEPFRGEAVADFADGSLLVADAAGPIRYLLAWEGIEETMTVFKVMYAPCSDLQVVGGHYHHNATNGGIVMGTNSMRARTRNIQIIGVSSTDHATGAGLRVGTTHDVQVSDCVFARNQGGLTISDSAGPIDEYVQRVTVRGCDIYENERAGVSLRSVEDVTVQNCRIETGAEGGIVIDVFRIPSSPGVRSTGIVRGVNKDIKLFDIDLSVTTIATDPDEIDTGTGHYRLRGKGSPSAHTDLVAPVGSTYLDTHAGRMYVLRDSGWIELAAVGSP